MDEMKAMLDWLEKLDSVEKENGEPSNAEDGGLAILGGRLLIKKPGKGGKWPTIAPCKEGLVRVLHGGIAIEKPLVLERTDDIEFKVLNKPASSFFRVEISPDNMEVWLITEFTEGTEYQIEDSDFVTDLVVSARKKHRLRPDAIDPGAVFQELDNIGIRIDPDRRAVIEACSSGKSARVLIGRGIPAKPPIDGRIEAVHDLTGKKIKKGYGEEDRIDWFDKGKFESVKPGEVLAYWHPAVEGKPGINVFGAAVEPRQPKWARFLAGPGVRLVEGGTVAVAEIAGRPCLERGQICVKPELIVSSDVDINTGNIEFTGDVIIYGDVQESLEVRAGGAVRVEGSVYHARIVAGGSVVIKRNLIGGHTSAGGELINSTKMVSLLKQIVPQLEKLQVLVGQLKSHPRFSVKDLKLGGDGHLIKLILETRLPELPKLFKEVLQLAPKLKKAEEEEESEISKISTVLQYIGGRYIGAKPLEIKSVSELQNCLNALRKIIGFLDDVLSTPADIKADYCQNAHLEATGDIIVSGRVIYGCSMSAGRSIELAGSCRGGHYFAGSSLIAGSAGLNETVKTHLAVEQGGFIAAGTFNPGVQIKIGAAKMAVRETRYNLKFQFEYDRWVEKDWVRRS